MSEKLKVESLLEINLTRLQRQIVNEILDPSFNQYSVSLGRRAGMTTALLLAMAEIKLQNPERNIYHLSPTFQESNMIRDRYLKLATRLNSRCDHCGQKINILDGVSFMAISPKTYYRGINLSGSLAVFDNVPASPDSSQFVNELLKSYHCTKVVKGYTLNDVIFDTHQIYPSLDF